MKLNPCTKCGCAMVLKHYKQPDSDGPFNSHNPQHEWDYIECIECHAQWIYVTPLSEVVNPEDLADAIAEKFAASLVLGGGKPRKKETPIPNIVTAWNTGDDIHCSCNGGTRFG